MDSQRRAAVRDGLGVGLAVGLSGLAFGAAAVAAGLGVAQACALSIVAFTGASQFALVGVVAGGGSLIAGALGAILLGGRNALYGLRLAPLLGARGWRRLPTAHLVIDETTAVATAQPGPRSARAGFWATAISLYLTWNLATLFGALGAARLGNPETYGLDVVGPAAFLALLWPRLASGGTERLVALLAMAVAVVTTPLLPPGVPVMVAAVAALAGIARRRTPPVRRAGELSGVSMGES
ncbi:AzlC family ABC transporter permease [Actinoallomurus spadix]|uniref:Branched-chain amino acid ABC transporter permease n=1 Tax=Actinoallomurus spadix TaxID=79912 RepID=A0ABN0W2X8_9ACTN|nr:AzlC family ABC transporter permease [Actinoallomurus spadix]MCO5985511.1 AzlC family ABC transporter permease [Actinoallomurus spadix]